MAVEQEFARATAQITSDPPGALTAACSTLESVCKTVLEESGGSLPRDMSIGPLWAATAKHLAIDPAGIPKDHPLAGDLRQILSGMFTTVQGIGALRTHAGDAHGRSEASSAPNIRKSIKPRHARLAVHSAHTLALFVLETWSDREA